MPMTKQYASWRARQKCWRCGQPTGTPDAVYCATCRPVIAQRSAAYYAKCKNNHVCPMCREAAMPGRVYCEACEEVNVLNRRADRAATGGTTP